MVTATIRSARSLSARGANPSVAAWQERVYKDLHAHPERARAAGRVEQDIPVNHSEFFAPVIEPTLSMGTQALVVAALAYLAK
jgi:hypothetical protein